MEISRLLPTPSARDWHSAGRKPRDSLDSLIEHGATKRYSGLFNFSQPLLPAKQLPKRAEDEARRTTVGSGRKLLMSYELSSQHGAFLRMCMAYLLLNPVWYSRNYALNWKGSVTKYNRSLFRLLPSTLRTGGTGSGLLRTPLVHEPGTAIDRLVTKDGQPYRIGKTGYNRLTGRYVRVGLSQQLGYVTGGRLQLQPAFVSWMMGLPEQWLTFPTERVLAKPGGVKKH